MPAGLSLPCRGRRLWPRCPWPPGHLCFLVRGDLRQLPWHVQGTSGVTPGFVLTGCEGPGRVWGLWEVRMLTMDGTGPPTAVDMEGTTNPGNSTRSTWPGLRCPLCPCHLTNCVAGM